MHERVLEISLLQDLPPRRILVVTPTYNEKDNVGAFIEAIGPTGADLLIVDDSSPDGTADVAREAAKKAPMRTWLMRRKNKAGLGTAYLDAYHWLIETDHPYEVIVQMDTDFSHDPSMVPALAEAGKKSLVAIGSRYIPGGNCPDWPLRRRLLSRFANLYVRTVLTLRFGAFKVHDATSGFIAWHRDVLKNVFSKEIKSKGYAFLVETKLQAVRLGYQPKELPITFRDRRHGVSKIDRVIVLEALRLPWTVGH